MREINFLLAGVGGQGTILASDVLAQVGVRVGYEAKKAEVHGMAQRGGSVVSHVRWGEKVYSPLTAKGEVDILVAFEKLEALRTVEFLRPGGTVLVNDQAIIPITVTSGGAEYPDDERIRAVLAQVTDDVRWVDGIAIAGELGNARVANVVLLGALSALLDVPESIWLEVIEQRVPARTVDLNRQAFHRGRQAVTR
ncbi:MAG: indolepyruvate oxidoreductase subunit beta [Anaerolineae bacterium]|nr:indolepyruvate oxidoreductase subunit beta [Anaerolineae bacterium]